MHDQEVLLGNAEDWDRVRMVFNGLGMTGPWAKHVAWLNERERLVATQVDQIGDWLVKL